MNTKITKKDGKIEIPIYYRKLQTQKLPEKIKIFVDIVEDNSKAPDKIEIPIGYKKLTAKKMPAKIKIPLSILEDDSKSEMPETIKLEIEVTSHKSKINIPIEPLRTRKKPK